MSGILDERPELLALARTGSGYDELVGELGFDLLTLDDRGYTYVRRTT